MEQILSEFYFMVFLYYLTSFKLRCDPHYLEQLFYPADSGEESLQQHAFHRG